MVQSAQSVHFNQLTSSLVFFRKERKRGDYQGHFVFAFPVNTTGSNITGITLKH